MKCVSCGTVWDYLHLGWLHLGWCPDCLDAEWAKVEENEDYVDYGNYEEEEYVDSDYEEKQ